MADDEKGTPAAPPPPPSQKPTLWIILFVINMVFVGGVGFLLYMEKQKKKHKDELTPLIKGEKIDQENENKDNFIGKLIPLETFLVNLSGSRGRKLLKIDMELEVNNEEVQAEIDKLKPKIRDIIIIVLSSKTYSHVSTNEGKDNLRIEIRDKVNLFLSKGQINRVYFTDFIYN